MGWKQQIVHILPSQKLPFFVQHKCCPFLWEDGIFSKIVLGSEKGVFEDCIVSNDTSIQCELRILDFFQNPHFFPKKWVINIYCTCQKYNSLRKYHSRARLSYLSHSVANIHCEPCPSKWKSFLAFSAFADFGKYKLQVWNLPMPLLYFKEVNLLICISFTKPLEIMFEQQRAIF